MQVIIAKNEKTGEILELDDLTFQFIQWLNENNYTEADPIYARVTLNTTVGKFAELVSKHSFEGEDQLLIAELDYFVELSTWVCWDKNKPKDANEEITLIFEVANVVYDKQNKKEKYESIEITYLKPFLYSLI